MRRLRELWRLLVIAGITAAVIGMVFASSAIAAEQTTLTAQVLTDGFEATFDLTTTDDLTRIRSPDATFTVVMCGADYSTPVDQTRWFTAGWHANFVQSDELAAIELDTVHAVTNDTPGRYLDDTMSAAGIDEANTTVDETHWGTTTRCGTTFPTVDGASLSNTMTTTQPPAPNLRE